MRLIKAMIIATGLGMLLTSCGSKTGDPQFQYSIDEFADIEVLRYQVPGWEDLSLQQKAYDTIISHALNDESLLRFWNKRLNSCGIW